ncbi:MAG: hypothetical protein IK066_12315, partial [Kiritimatiellae bacterium]|nr:hypothetical protein [Kiritimatiellia bacterium]
MKKLTVLCRAADRDALLAGLRELGVLHVKPFAAPAGAGLETARAKADLLRRVLEQVPKGEASENAGDATALADKLAALLDERKSTQNRIEAVEAEIARVAPLGDFEPSGIADLAAKGVVLKLYRAPLKSTPDTPEGVCAELLGQRKSDGYWALFASKDFEWAGAEELRLPERSLSGLQKDVDGLRASLAEGEKEFAAASQNRAGLEALL